MSSPRGCCRLPSQPRGLSPWEAGLPASKLPLSVAERQLPLKRNMAPKRPHLAHGRTKSCKAITFVLWPEVKIGGEIRQWPYSVKSDLKGERTGSFQKANKLFRVFWKLRSRYRCCWMICATLTGRRAAGWSISKRQGLRSIHREA